jgi:hypothetical protein
MAGLRIFTICTEGLFSTIPKIDASMNSSNTLLARLTRRSACRREDCSSSAHRSVLYVEVVLERNERDPEILGVKAVAFDQHGGLIRVDEVGSWQKGV